MADLEIWEEYQWYGPYLSLLIIFAFMVWVRIRPADRVITDTTINFSGNDPWYHARVVQFTVRHFPATMSFDPWTHFPFGTGRHSGFGGLFDQLIALAALVVGLGDPSPRLVEIVTAYAPAVFGAVTVVPAYLVAKELTDRWSALLTGILLAIVGGQFLSRTVIGVSDHQSAEAFFGTLALAGFIYAFKRSYIEQPTFADVKDRNWRILKLPATAGLLGGISIAGYLMMWPPGVAIIFTLGVFVVIQIIRDYRNSRSTEYLVFATVTTFLTAAVLTLAYVKSYVFRATAFSLLQPMVLSAIAIGAALMWGVARYFDQKGYDRQLYPPAIGALILGSFLIVNLIYPPTFGLFESLIGRIYSYGLRTGATGLTVAEIQPATLRTAWEAYAGLFPIAVMGFLLLISRVLRENNPTELIVLLWSFTITSAYFSMTRFGYYMGVTVTILAGYVIWWTASFVNLDTINKVSDFETYQLIVVLVIAIAIIPGNIIAVGGASPPAWETADRLGGTNSAWQNELLWLKNNSPAVPMDQYDRHGSPKDNDFNYPDGAYGVMSWWDYGHWITYTGERIPIANPFQQGPRPASAFLLAQNETRANLILDALPAGDTDPPIWQMSQVELAKVKEELSAQQVSENTRYVMIDDQMAAGKFSAIATWTGPGPGTYFSRQEFQVGNQQAQLIGPNDDYENTMLAQLYFQDARGLSHYRLVHETGQSAIVSVAQQGPQGFQSTDFIHRRLSSQVFAAVQQRQDLAFYNVRQPASVKTFERVPGATLRGQVATENATTVFATVQLQTNRGRNFTYVQTVRTDDEGDFEMTVPYATTNTVGPHDGGTDSGVEALGQYQLFAGNPFAPSARGNTSVPEPSIYDGETLTVNLEPVERPSANETNTSNGNGNSNGSSLRAPRQSDPSASFAPTGQLNGIHESGNRVVAARRAVDG